LGRQIAMHIAAARPEAVNIEDVDASSLERERSVLADQARASGKPEEIIAKMVEGRLRKYYEEVVLLEQVYVIDGENKVRKVVETVAKEIGAPIKVVGFTRYVLGEASKRSSPTLPPRLPHRRMSAAKASGLLSPSPRPGPPLAKAAALSCF
jgi:elongation factor Ts